MVWDSSCSRTTTKNCSFGLARTQQCIAWKYNQTYAKTNNDNKKDTICPTKKHDCARVLSQPIALDLGWICQKSCGILWKGFRRYTGWTTNHGDKPRHCRIACPRLQVSFHPLLSINPVLQEEQAQNVLRSNVSTCTRNVYSYCCMPCKDKQSVGEELFFQAYRALTTCKPCTALQHNVLLCLSCHLSGLVVSCRQLGVHSARNKRTHGFQALSTCCTSSLYAVPGKCEANDD